MKNLLVKVFRISNGLLYNILGSAAASNLAVSPMGKLIFKVVSGNSSGLQVYEGIQRIKIRLSPQEANILGFLHVGMINPYETKFLQSYMQPGDVFIDVGAYVDGWYTLLAAKLVGKEGKVYSFEPDPQYYQRLVDNVALNKFSQVQTEKLALADKNEVRTFYEADSVSSFYKTNSSQTNVQAKAIKVRTVTLDDYVLVKKLGKIRLIKIDVEGAEMEVLRGAKKILSSKNGPDLLVEVIDAYLKNAGSSKREVMSFLQMKGYKAYTIRKNGITPYEASQADYNLFFTKHQS